MKLRLDFVTNSSSSSFLLARKGGLNEKQKQAILDYIEENFFGDKALGPESSEEEIKEVIENEYFAEIHEEELRTALKEGNDIYIGEVSFENSENDYADIFEDIWRIMDKNADGNFTAIEDDLSY